jgi:Sec23/Sec24 zinc finger
MKEKSREKPGKYRQEVDTNVYQIQLACLKDAGELATGDPLFCKSCQAVFNKHSKLEETKDPSTQEVIQQIWNCEFCLTKNIVNLEEEERPKTSAVNYIVEAAAQIKDKKAGGAQAGADVSVVFCVDISGSMCVSLPI